MTPYKNLWWDSNVVSYTYWNDFITVNFASGTYTIYTYTYISAGSSSVDHMKKLADSWHWLNSYISTHKPWYASKR